MANRYYHWPEVVFQPIPTFPSFTNLTGEEINQLTVLGYAGRGKRSRSFFWCLCNCGNIFCTRADRLNIRKTVSCGCYARELNRIAKTTHGKWKDPKYHLWTDIKQRCLNKKNKAYKDYGGRGITICSGWKNSVTKFMDDMGEKPSPEYTIDRIKNNKGYWCGNCEECISNQWESNCRWADKITQENNKRNNKFITYNGQTKTIAQWARFYNLEFNFFKARLDTGWCMTCAIVIPAQSPRNRGTLKTKKMCQHR